jgi:hypothetical protein
MHMAGLKTKISKLFFDRVPQLPAFNGVKKTPFGAYLQFLVFQFQKIFFWVPPQVIFGNQICNPVDNICI